MSKNTYFFSHDLNSHQDEKIIDLRIDHGMEGYGVYWLLVELLAGSSDYRMDLAPKRIAFAHSVDPSVVSDVISNYGLFEVDGEKFFSKSLITRMSRLDTIKEKRAEAGRMGGIAKAKASKPLAKASKCLANSSKGKERKGKDRKVESKKARASSSEEMAEYCESIGLERTDGGAAWDKWNGNGWKNGSNPIKDWKSTIRSWKAQGYMPSQKNPSLKTKTSPSAQKRIEVNCDEHRRKIIFRDANGSFNEADFNRTWEHFTYGCEKSRSVRTETRWIEYTQKKAAQC